MFAQSEAINTIDLQTELQFYTVHQIRNSMKYAPCKYKKKVIIKIKKELFNLRFACIW